MKHRASPLAVRTKLQGQLIWLIFGAMAIPTLVFGTAIWLLADGATHPERAVSPHMTILKAAALVAAAFPILFGVFLFWAFHATNRIVGPVERITRELDARIAGTARGPIHLRPGDALDPLAQRLNQVLADWDRRRTPPARDDSAHAGDSAQPSHGSLSAAPR
jgi:hypothetical protein